MNLQMTYMNPLSLDTLLPERPLHFVQGGRCITIGLGAAVEDNYLSHRTILVELSDVV